MAENHPQKVLQTQFSHGFIATFSTPADYIIIVSAFPGAGGTVSGGGTFAMGSTQLVVAVPSAGYVFSGWTQNGQTFSPSNSYSFVLNDDVSLVANFAIKGSPKLTITSPISGQTVSNAPCLVAGTVTDTVAVDGVFFRVNTNSWTLAATNSSWSNWTASVTLTPGTNTLRAYAVDTSGIFSPTNSISFKFFPSATLTVNINGTGTVTPTNNKPLVAIGTNYTLTAAPAKNWLFSNWVASGSEVFVTTNPSLTFTMQSNLTLTANFVTNLFLAAPGTYNGLFAPTNGPRQPTNSGAITLTLTTNGAWTGKLTVGNNISALTGRFSLAGWSTNITKRPGLTTLTTILQLDSASQTIQGAVGDGSFSAAILADQAVFSSTHLAAAYEGLYTLIIPGVPSPAVGPLGSSYGTVTVSSTGTITFAGSLADGTAIGPVTSDVSGDGYWPLYLPLYGDAGSLWGWSLFTDQSLFATNLSWINATNTVKTAADRSGFTNQQVSIVASPFNSNAIPLLSLTNAEVILKGVGLTVPITNTITLSRTDVITTNKVPGNTNKLTLTITKSSGLITGSFVNPANPKQTNAIGGVLLQNQTNAQGYFLGTNQNGVFLLTAP